MKTNWIKRKKTKTIYVGNVPVGGNNPISVQSMTNTDTCDVVSTINQINDLKKAIAVKNNLNTIENKVFSDNNFIAGASILHGRHHEAKKFIA